MKRKITLLAITMMVGMLLLTGCRPSDEKLSEVETAMGLLLEAQGSAKEVYLDITDDSMQQTLDELDKKVAELEQIDFTKYSDKKIDEILPTITELTSQYQSLQSGFETVLDTETKEKEEAARITGLGAYLINNTGMNLIEVVLHDITQDTYSENLLGDGVTLESGYILMGVVLDVDNNSSEWEFVIKNDNNTSYTLSCDSLEGADKDGISITLKYDSNAQTGSVVIGGYSVDEASTEESVENAASEAASEG